jgi:hypothetical protein
MSRSRRNRIETLKNRARFLDNRITQAEALGKDFTFDKAEISALQWAMPILEAHVEANRILHEQLKKEKDERE